MNMQFPFAYLETKNDYAKAKIGWVGILSLLLSEACYKHVNS